MQEEELTELRVQLAKLELAHADLDRAIDALVRVGGDALCIQRFKKKKLSMKDEITALREKVLPDIIA